MHTTASGTARTTRDYLPIVEEVCRTHRPRIQPVFQSVRRLCGEFLRNEALEYLRLFLYHTICILHLQVVKKWELEVLKRLLN